MPIFPGPPGARLKSAIKWGVATTLGMQVAAASAVVAVDAARKHRDPGTGNFPHVPPRTTQVSESEITIYTYGEDLFSAMLEAIRNAKDRIYFETFIMKADNVGFEFRGELIAAAERGVEVYIILDTFGNLNQDPRFRQFPDMQNLHVINFPAFRSGFITGRARDKGFDHRKILTVDGALGFVGGFNIGRLYAHHWRDTHMRISGPQTWELDNAFVDMWNAFRSSDQPELPDSGLRSWSPSFQAVQNIPAFRAFPVRNLYLEAIDRASTRVWITMGYFIPDDAMKASLIAAAKRGVDVRVLIPQYSNHIVADWVGRPHYSDLLRGGVRIFLFEEAMIHAKTMTVDGVWSTVGTTNIDSLSMAGNFEINVAIYDSGLADIMEEIFAVDLSNSHELLPEVWEHRSNAAKFAERVLKPLAPLF